MPVQHVSYAKAPVWNKPLQIVRRMLTKVHLTVPKRNVVKGEASMAAVPQPQACGNIQNAFFQAEIAKGPDKGFIATWPFPEATKGCQ